MHEALSKQACKKKSSLCKKKALIQVMWKHLSQFISQNYNFTYFGKLPVSEKNDEIYINKWMFCLLLKSLSKYRYLQKFLTVYIININRFLSIWELGDITYRCAIKRCKNSIKKSYTCKIYYPLRSNMLCF